MFINPITNDYTPVDLGLSVQWYSMNLGAQSPEDYGAFFEWADPRPHEKSFGPELSNPYRRDYWADGRLQYYYSKYYTYALFRRGVPDNLIYLQASDDPAACIMQGKWRTPTPDEWEELFTLCKWELEEINGVKCHKVTGPSLNYIYIPVYYKESVTKYWNTVQKTIHCSYWTNKLHANDNDRAYCAKMTLEQKLTISNEERKVRMYVRPVLDYKQDAETATISFIPGIGANFHNDPTYRSLHFYKNIKRISVGGSYYYVAQGVTNNYLSLIDSKQYTPISGKFDEIYTCKNEYRNVDGDLVWIRCGDKWGLFNVPNRRAVIEPCYDSVEYIGGPQYNELRHDASKENKNASCRYLVTKDGKIGLHDGPIIWDDFIPCFRFASESNDRRGIWQYAVCVSDGKKYLMNHDGTYAYHKAFDEIVIDPFEYFIFRSDNLYGLFKDGLRLDIVYQSIQRVNSSFYKVKYKDNPYIYNLDKGEWMYYDDIEKTCVASLFVLRKNEEYGLCNQEGNVLLDCNYDDIIVKSYDLVLMKSYGQYGYFKPRTGIKSTCGFFSEEDAIEKSK